MVGWNSAIDRIGPAYNPCDFDNSAFRLKQRRIDFHESILRCFALAVFAHALALSPKPQKAIAL